MSEMKEAIEELKERLAKLERELQYYTSDEWQSVWKNIDPEELTPEQEAAWMNASARARQKREELPGLIKEVEAKIAELEK